MRQYRRDHIDEARERSRLWRAANPDKKQAQRRRQYDRLRNAVLDHYGWACACCGTCERLTMDHVNGDGHQHRAQLGRAPEALYRWIIAHGFPADFQTLCVPATSARARAGGASSCMSLASRTSTGRAADADASGRFLLGPGDAMARYQIRDLIGHFVAPRSQEGKLCRHACCRNRRVHPSNFPVILPSPLLKRATDNDLAEHYGRLGSGPKADKARAQVMHEMDRRDRVDLERLAKADAAKARQFSRKLERAEAIDHSWLRAEEATRGNMLNRAGKAAGVDERTLFTGSEARARKYASEELLNHWQSHPRPTAAMFAGQDTRLGAVYSAPRRRQHGTVRTRTVTTGSGKSVRTIHVAVVKKNQ